MSKQTLSRELRRMGYRRLSARPRHHAQATGAIEAFAIEAFKKSLPARLDAIGRAAGVGTHGIEVWFADEARVGQKNKITRRGTRPSAPQDQRTASTYIFGAICPATGTTAGLVLP